MQLHDLTFFAIFRHGTEPLSVGVGSFVREVHSTLQKLSNYQVTDHNFRNHVDFVPNTNDIRIY